MEAGSPKKTVRVNIFNQSFNLVAEGDEREVEALANVVDELITQIARHGNIDAGRAAVLACLHLADETRALQRKLADTRTDIESKTRRINLLLEKAIG